MKRLIVSLTICLFALALLSVCVQEQLDCAITVGSNSRTSGVFDPGVPISVSCDAEDIHFSLTARNGGFSNVENEEYAAYETVVLFPDETAYWYCVNYDSKEFNGEYQDYVDVLILRGDDIVGYACVSLYPDERHSAWTGEVVCYEEFMGKKTTVNYYEP